MVKRIGLVLIMAAVTLSFLKPEDFNRLEPSFEGQTTDSVAYKVYALKTKGFWQIWVVSDTLIQSLSIDEHSSELQAISEFTKEGLYYILQSGKAKYKDQKVTVGDLKLQGYYELTASGKLKHRIIEKLQNSL